MRALPWPITHGDTIWQLGLALLLLCGLAVALWLPRRAARREARAARGRFGAPLASMARLNDGMRVTLTGRLVVSGAPCERFEDGAAAAAASVAYERGRGAWVTGLNARAEELALVVGDATVALAGPVEVVAGAREARLGRPLRAFGEAVRARVARGFQVGSPHFADSVVVFRSVGGGDLVRVSGVLRREAEGGGAAGYRDVSSRWSLVPDAAGARVDEQRGMLLAFEGAPAVAGPALRAYPLGLAAGAVAFALLFGLGGEIAAASAVSSLDAFAAERWDPERPQAEPLPPDAGLAAASLAASTPLRRPQILSALRRALAARAHEDPSVVARRAALEAFAGDRRAAAAAWIDHGFLERGAREAAACGDFGAAARALYADARFEQASLAREKAAPEPGPPDDADLRFGVRVHLLASRFEPALAEARRLQGALEARAKADPSGPSPERAALARCLAAALETRRDAAAGATALRREAESTKLGGCLLLAADALAGEERLALLRAIDVGWDAASAGSSIDVGRDAASAGPSIEPRGALRAFPERWRDLLEVEADPRGMSVRRPPVLESPGIALTNPERLLSLSIPALERGVVEALEKERLDPPEPAAAPAKASRRGEAKEEPPPAVDARGLRADERRSAPEPPDERLEVRARLALQAAAFASIAGDHAEAERLAKRAADDLDALAGAPGDAAWWGDHRFPRSWDRDQVTAFRAALALHAGKVDEARKLLEPLDKRAGHVREVAGLIAYRTTGDTEAMTPFLAGWSLLRQGENRAWAIAASGDGAALAAYLREPYSEPAAFLRLGAPHVRGRKDALASWLRSGYRRPKWYAPIGDRLAETATLAAAADAIGEAALAGQLRDRADRYRAALGRRDVAVLLAVLERL